MKDEGLFARRCCHVHYLIRSLVVRPVGAVVLEGIGVGIGVGVGMFVIVVGIVLALAVVHSLVGLPVLLFILSWLCWRVRGRTGWRGCCCRCCCCCCARRGVVVGLMVLSSSMS